MSALRRLIPQRLAGSVLGNREFRTLWISLIASVAGDQVFPVAVVVSLLDAGGTATEVGAVLASRWAALVLFGLFGGVWADRLPRRHVMLASQAFLCCVVMVGLAGVTSAWVLGGMVFLAGAAEAFMPGFLDLTEDLGAGSAAGLRGRALLVRDFLPRLREVRDHILAANPGVED
ncbi:MFS transporter [Streptosporangium algeriense]|uniref:MFS transporter n=1 Tax=Streptosporangium algeriense TaxID=1682748 RepID=A0ABW3DL35_9ACTN